LSRVSRLCCMWSPLTHPLLMQSATSFLHHLFDVVGLDPSTSPLLPSPVTRASGPASVNQSGCKFPLVRSCHTSDGNIFQTKAHLHCYFLCLWGFGVFAIPTSFWQPISSSTPFPLTSFKTLHDRLLSSRKNIKPRQFSSSSIPFQPIHLHSNIQTVHLLFNTIPTHTSSLQY